MPTLVLASASPARRTTLARAGLDVHVQVSGVDEEAAVAAEDGGLQSFVNVNDEQQLARARAARRG